MHRRRSYVGRLADFSELSLYRNDVPFMGFQPAELVVQDMHGLLADSGCNEYSASESKRVRHKIVAARTGNGCTTRRKAIHAMNAGATAFSAQSDIERLAQQIDMPVVIISQSVFEELEGYLVSGLR
ncbi:hypothetical protein GGH99_005444, partial [Coemansia sp. RSA 1285]